MTVAQAEGVLRTAKADWLGGGCAHGPPVSARSLVRPRQVFEDDGGDLDESQGSREAREVEEATVVATRRLRRLRASGIQFDLNAEESYADLFLDLPKAAVAVVAQRSRNSN